MSLFSPFEATSFQDIIGPERFEKLQETLSKRWEETARSPRPSTPPATARPAGAYAGELHDFLVSVGVIDEYCELVKKAYTRMLPPDASYTETIIFVASEFSKEKAIRRPFDWSAGNIWRWTNINAKWLNEHCYDN